MKRFLYGFSFTLITTLFLFSCKKEALQSPEASRTSVDGSADLIFKGIPIGPPKKLRRTTQFGNPKDSFSYDNYGRIVRHTEGGGPNNHLTTYTYSGSQVKIKRIAKWDLNTPWIDAVGTLDNKGRITQLQGIVSEEFGFVETVNYTFTYDADGHLIQWKGGASTPHGNQFHNMVYTWENGNMVKSEYYRDFIKRVTKTYKHNLSQPDKRGVWQDIKYIWADDLFGVRNKNMMTEYTQYVGDNDSYPYTAKYSWTLNLGNYPISQGVLKPDGSIQYSIIHICE